MEVPAPPCSFRACSFRKFGTARAGRGRLFYCQFCMTLAKGRQPAHRQLWLLIRTEKSLIAECVTTKSGHPSPFKSPAATEYGVRFTGTTTGLRNVPSPLPKTMSRELEKELDNTRSL